MNNDWHRLMEAMVASLEDDADGQGTRLLLFRQQVAYHHEATKFLAGSCRQYTEVEKFIGSLDSDAKALYDTIVEIDAAFQRWPQEHRNVTFHYPKMVRKSYENGEEHIANALVAAANFEGSIIANDGAGPRFGFADEAAIQLLGGVDKVGEMVKQVSDARHALGGFVYAAIKRYLESCDQSIFRIDT